MSRRALTVLGPLDPDRLGVTLTHEHVLFEQRPKLPPPEPEPVSARALAEATVDMRHLGLLRRQPSAIHDNWRVADLELAAREVLEFKGAGGGSIVEVSTRGIGRDPAGLRVISARTGVPIVAACGYYTGHFHPASMAERSIDDVAAEFVREVSEGIDGTGVRAGVIGEIGTGEPLYLPSSTWDVSGEPDMSPSEKKVLRAAGRAQRETDAPVSVHIYNYRPNRLAHHVLDVLHEEGADLARVVICHLDTRPDPDYASSIADRGAFIEFDTFGMEFVFDSTFTQFPRDSERIALVSEMVRRGYVDHILLSHDVCWKSLLVSYGGYGYAHLSRHVEPWLRHAGLSEAHIRTMRVDNPARWLAFEC
jgi:phosphotriesterase-related protein